MSDLSSNFSAYHLHRIFMAWMDETLGDFLGRRRLDVASLMLSHQPGVSVLDVALSVGFGSGEAFARAFKARFGCTPSAWRQGTAQRWAQDLAQARQHARPWLPQDSNLDLADHPAHGHDGKTFDTSQGLGQATCYGIGHDDPYLTPPEKCRCDTCVEVPADFVATSPASIATLPGGRYAVAHHWGDGTDIAQAWTHLMRDWLPASSLQVDGRPFFERYGGGAVSDSVTGQFDCMFCMPVKPL